MRPWRPPFHASPLVHKGPISSNGQFTSPPFEKKWEILTSKTSIFSQILALKPKIRKFSVLISFQIWKFSVHKTPLSETMISSQAPHFGNPSRTPLPEKKVECLPWGFVPLEIVCLIFVLAQYFVSILTFSIHFYLSSHTLRSSTRWNSFGRQISLNNIRMMCLPYFWSVLSQFWLVIATLRLGGGSHWHGIGRPIDQNVPAPFGCFFFRKCSLLRNKGSKVVLSGEPLKVL